MLPNTLPDHVEEGSEQLEPATVIEKKAAFPSDSPVVKCVRYDLTALGANEGEPLSARDFYDRVIQGCGERY